MSGDVGALAAEFREMRAEVMGMLKEINAKVDKVALALMYK